MLRLAHIVGEIFKDQQVCRSVGHYPFNFRSLLGKVYQGESICTPLLRESSPERYPYSLVGSNPGKTLGTLTKLYGTYEVERVATQTKFLCWDHRCWVVTPPLLCEGSRRN